MTIYELLNNMGVTDYIGLAVLIISIVQVSPIKINPWTKIARAIGRALNVELMDKIDEKEANDVRYRIIRFDDEIRHHTMHTEEHFNQIIEDIDKYEDYCLKHPSYENNKAKMAIQNIKKTYSTCRAENTFFI
jgi:hypothetical protein